MSDITLLISRLRNGAWGKRWPVELLITAARTIEDLLDENNKLQEERNFLFKDCDRLRKELDEANGVIR